MPNGPAIVWFRNDLRLEDNPALKAAVDRGGPVIPVFIWAPDEEAPWPPGAASRWWLHQSLRQLDAALRRRGSRLILRADSTEEALIDIVSSTRAEIVYFCRRYVSALRKRDRQTSATIQSRGVAVESFGGNLLFEPWEVLTKSQKPYQVYTPFWRACLRRSLPRRPIAGPKRIEPCSCWPKSLVIEDLGLEPKIDWAAGLRATWSPGEKGARTLLKRFRSRLKDYREGRDRPDEQGTSRLSPHLHFGEISPRQIWYALRANTFVQQREKFLSELGWREFAHHVLYHFPNTSDRPLRNEFREFRWHRSPSALRKWQRGLTGYPIVDAGMRALWSTGWMHNRVRMVVASFLTKDLLISWREGARWFWDTLVDADLANNTLGWQWTAGFGADAAPFFRIFNPVSQGQKFDPQGTYVRLWVPELARLPTRWIHRPWDAPQEVLAAAGVVLGRNYPKPLVDHAEARAFALAALRSRKTPS